MRGLILTAVVAMIVIAGCGGSDSEPEHHVGVNFDQTTMKQGEGEHRQGNGPAAEVTIIHGDSTAGFTGKQQSRYVEDRAVCEVFPATQIAKQQGVPADSDWRTIALKYAEGFQPAFQRAAFEGCLAGIERREG
jgi:hypothetical protein